MRTAQRADAADLHDRARGAAGRAHHAVAFDVEAVGERLAHRDPLDALASLLDAVGDRLAQIVVDAHDRAAAILHARDQPLLDRRIVRERAVAVEVILGDVEQDADRRIERGREIDLERGALDDVHAPGRRRLEREDGGADVSAELRVVVRAREEMRDQRRGGRLAVGAGDRDERRVRRGAAPLAAEQLDVADHLDRGIAREADGPVRRRMSERHAGRQHQRVDPAPVDAAQIGNRNAGGARLLDARFGIVPSHHIGTAGEQRACAGKPGRAEPEQRDLLSGEAW